jgi:DDE domain
VDPHGNVLDILVTSRRNTRAATRFFRKLLKGLEYVPRVLITDKLRSYAAARRRVLRSVTHRQSKYLNNRAENSHQTTRHRERAMKKFTAARSRKKLTRWLCWFRWVVRRCHRTEDGDLEPRGKLTTDIARNAHTTPTNIKPEKKTLIFYGSPDTPNGSSPPSAASPHTSGPTVTDSPPRNTAAT